MQTQSPSLDLLSDSDLVAEVKRLLRNEHEATAQFVAYLGELDERRLYLAEGYRSMFQYCTDVLSTSEDETFFRIHAARVARQFPAVLGMLAAGSIHLTTVRLISSHLTAENATELLSAVAGKSKREVEHYVAARFPQVGPADSVRKLPAPKSTVPASPPAPAPAPAIPSRDLTAAPELPVQARPPRPAVVAPVAAEQYKIAFTMNAATRAKLQKAQDLLRHAVPSGDLAVIFDRALTLLVADLERKKCAETDRPRPQRESAGGSRHIPAAVRREVWRRDGGQCAFVGKNGRRCDSRALLEYHHVVPYAVGGQATVEGIELRCRAHNGYEAELFFGRRGPVAREPRGLYGARSGTSGESLLDGRFGRPYHPDKPLS
jgi:hypothetical protein